MSFEALMGALGTLSKSMPADDTNKDAKVAAAAADGAAASAAADGAGEGNGGAGEGQGQGSGEGEGAGEAGSAGAAAGEGQGGGEGATATGEEGTGEGEGESLGKSFTLELENGEEVEAFDATQLLKSMNARLVATEQGLAAAGQGIKATEDQAVAVIGKAVEIITAQGGVIADLKKSLDTQSTTVTEQAELIKSLRADLDELRNQPAGRKSVTNPVQVSADATLAKSINTIGEGEQKGLPPAEFLAKCLSMQKSGKLTMQECILAEAAIGSGVPVDQAIVTKVFSTNS